MIPVPFEEVEALGLGVLDGEPPARVVTRIHADSRVARPGDLFVALNTGVRYLVPCVPFLFLAAASVLVRLPRPLAVGIALGAVGWSWAHAMVRETPWESVRAVLAGGPQLPWLTSVWRSGARAPLLLRDSGPLAWPLLLPAAAALAILWRPSRSRAGVLDEGI